MKTTLVMLGALALGVAGCASPQIVPAPVGPNPAAQANPSGTGHLEVFSALQLHRDGTEFDINPPWYQHSDYNIYTMDGRPVRHVFNSVGHYAQPPAMVTLPAGSYLIKARAQDYLTVETPVVIKPGLTTRVHLDDKWQPPLNTPPSALVRVPDGKPIGWRTSSS